MRKKLLLAMASIFLAGAAVLFPLTAAQAIETFQMETELRIYNPAKSYGGYFMPSNYDLSGFFGGAPTGNTSYLMDMEGYVVKKWDHIFGWAPRIQEDGTVWGGGYIHDWDGNMIWSYTTAPYMAHHAWQKMWNKRLNKWTMLVLCNKNVTQADMVARGWDPSVTLSDARRGAYDFLAEITIDTKEIVWEWWPWDHLIQSKNPAWPNYVSNVKDAPGRFDMNWMIDNERPATTGTGGVGGTAGPVNDWWHVNSIDYDDDTGHVCINPKHWSDFVVIDHDKTFVSATNWAANKTAAAGPDGDLIYRWGNPSSYNAGVAPGWMTEGDSQMYGSHDIQFIHPYHWKIPRLATDTWPDPRTYVKSGITLPGAGNFIIFDNGCYNPAGMKSRVLEINGRIGASGSVEAALGKYIWQPVAGYKPYAAGGFGAVARDYHASKQLVWSFKSATQHSFYSSHISGQQRLPNGNTAIDAGNQGHFFEVTPSGEVVWEYLYPGIPGTAADPLGGGFFPINKDGSNAQCYRMYRYGTDYPAFTGKNLTRIGTLSGRIPRLVGSSDTYPPATIYTGFGYGASGVAVGGGGGVGGGTGGGGGGGY